MGPLLRECAGSRGLRRRDARCAVWGCLLEVLLLPSWMINIDYVWREVKVMEEQELVNGNSHSWVGQL